MNYRHSYHAGNFADVFKHFILTQLLVKLRVKDTPFCVLDTHSGIGHYNLFDETAQKTGEYMEGIGRIMKESLPEAFQTYLTIVKAENFQSDELRFYPGSPAISRAMLREQDRLVLAELHPDDAMLLKENFKNDKQVAAHHMDGYTSMKAFLPPKERRGLVLIDPPFEKTDEFDTIIKALSLGYHRFRQGMFAIWYPIKDRLTVQQFHNNIAALGIQKVLITEILIHQEYLPDRLNGCGMVIINPPWQLDSDLQVALQALLPIMTADGDGSVRVDWLS